MTTKHSILAILSQEQATTEAIAETLRQPPVVIAAFCCDLEKEALATSHALGDSTHGKKLITWRITEKGKARASELTAPAKEPQLALS